MCSLMFLLSAVLDLLNTEENYWAGERWQALAAKKVEGTLTLLCYGMC